MPTVRTAALSLRLSPSERTLLAAAAGQARTHLSEFVRRRALEAAKADLMDRRIGTIAAKDWARFEAWASAPAKEVPALRQLSEVRPRLADLAARVMKGATTAPSGPAAARGSA